MWEAAENWNNFGQWLPALRLADDRAVIVASLGGLLANGARSKCDARLFL
jgi:hypothetical protein